MPVMLSKHAFQWMLIVLGLALIIFLRAPDVLLLPALQVEDGARVFAHFYQHRDVAQIFRFKSGYIPLLANLIGYCSVRLPTRLIPYGLTLIPFVITLASYSLFFSARYRTWLPQDASRAAACILFALAPISQFNVLSNTDYSIWNTLMLFLLLVACPFPQGRWGRYLYWLACNVLAWSHPSTIIAFPIVLCYMWKRPQDRWLYGLLIGNLIAHHVFGTESASAFSGLGIAGVVLKIVTSGFWTLVLVGKIAFRTVAGVPLSHWADAHMRFLAVYWGVFLAIATARMVSKRPHTRIPVICLFYLIFGLTFLNVLARGYEIAGKIDLSPRFVYLQSLCFLVLFVMLATCLVVPAKGSAAAPDGKTASGYKPRKRLSLILAGLLGHYLLLNTQLENVRTYYHYYHPDNGKIVRAFFQELAAIEKKTGTTRGIHLVATKIDDWPIVIDTRNAQEKEKSP